MPYDVFEDMFNSRISRDIDIAMVPLHLNIEEALVWGMFGLVPQQLKMDEGTENVTFPKFHINPPTALTKFGVDSRLHGSAALAVVEGSKFRNRFISRLRLAVSDASFSFSVTSSITRLGEAPPNETPSALWEFLDGVARIAARQGIMHKAIFRFRPFEATQVTRVRSVTFFCAESFFHHVCFGLLFMTPVHLLLFRFPFLSHTFFILFRQPILSSRNSSVTTGSTFSSSQISLAS